MTGTRWNAPAAAGMPPTPRRGCGRAGHGHLRPERPGRCVFLLVMHHVPVERCAGILEAMSGARPSDGCYAHPGLAGRRG